MIKSLTIKHVTGLNDILEQFGFCNIDLTAEFDSTSFEPFPVPTILTDIKLEKNLTLFLKMHDSRSYYTNHGYKFKYRKDICTLEIIFRFDENAFDILRYHDRSRGSYRVYGHMDDKYIVIVRHELRFESESLHDVLDIKYLIDCKIFVWTVINCSNTV